MPSPQNLHRGEAVRPPGSVSEMTQASTGLQVKEQWNVKRGLCRPAATYAGERATTRWGATAYADVGSGDGELRDGRRDGELRERMRA